MSSDKTMFDKKTILVKINDLHDQMEQARMDRDDRNAGQEIEMLADEIAKLIDQLCEQETDPHQEISYLTAASHLRHTNSKEVGFISSAYKATLKRKAAYLRTTEYYDRIDKALRQIGADIGLILIEARKTDQ